MALTSKDKKLFGDCDPHGPWFRASILLKKCQSGLRVDLQHWPEVKVPKSPVHGLTLCDAVLDHRCHALESEG